MLSAYSRVQPSPSSGSIILIFTDSRSRASIAAITCSTGRFVNFVFIVSSVLKFVNAAHSWKRKIRFDPLPQPCLHSTLVFSNQFEKADDLLPRRRFAERMSLETRKGSLLDDCDDSAVTISPNTTASKAVTGRAITSFVMTSWPAAFRLARGTRRGPTLRRARGESNQEIPGIAVRQVRQVMSG